MSKDEKKALEPKSGNLVSPSLGPLDDMDAWIDEMRRHWMLPFFAGRAWPEVGMAFGGRTPRVDVIDREDEVCVRAELPGVKKDDLDVTLQDNAVTIRATTSKEEKSEEKGHFYRRELVRGEFLRTIRLPAPVVDEKAKAAFKDGILELTLPKAPGAKRQSIKVE